MYELAPNENTYLSKRSTVFLTRQSMTLVIETVKPTDQPTFMPLVNMQGIENTCVLK